MNNPLPNIPEPSSPEHDLLRNAGSLPVLTPGLRDRVLLNCHQQVRYGRRIDQLRIAGSVVAACLMVMVIWTYHSSGRHVPQTEPAPHDTASQESIKQDVPPRTYPYSNPGVIAEDAGTVETDEDGKPLPQGGPSLRHQSMPEMKQLDQMLEKLQNRHNVLCGLLPYL